MLRFLLLSVICNNEKIPYVETLDRFGVEVVYFSSWVWIDFSMRMMYFESFHFNDHFNIDFKIINISLIH